MNDNELTRARFIVLEGPDNTGKSTQARFLARFLTEVGHPAMALLVAQPTRDEPYGIRIRRILEGAEAHPGAEEFARLFAMDRMQHAATQIIPRLMEGCAVVCDRYVLSSIAYQHGLYGLDADYVRSLSRYVPTPDITIVLDAAEKVALERGRQHGVNTGNTMHHSLEQFRKVRTMYRMAKLLLPEQRVEYVCSDGTMLQVASSIVGTLVGCGLLPADIITKLK